MKIAFTQFTSADYSIIAIIVLSTLISLARGFIREAISLVTWVVAVWIAIRFMHIVSDALTNYIQSPQVRLSVAFACLLITVLILGALLNHLFSQLIENIGLNGIDRLLGAIFGVARGIVLIEVLVLGGLLLNFTQANWWQHSQLIPFWQNATITHRLQSVISQHINNNSSAIPDIN